MYGKSNHVVEKHLVRQSHSVTVHVIRIMQSIGHNIKMMRCIVILNQSFFTLSFHQPQCVGIRRCVLRKTSAAGNMLTCLTLSVDSRKHPNNRVGVVNILQAGDLFCWETQRGGMRGGGGCWMVGMFRVVRKGVVLRTPPLSGWLLSSSLPSPLISPDLLCPQESS